MTIPVPMALSLRPELMSKCAAFYAALDGSDQVPRRTLELCRMRIAAIHDCNPEWSIEDADTPLTGAEADNLRQGRFDEFSAAERAALALAEKISFQHHQISDAEVERVRLDLGAAGTVVLLTALGFFDANCRLRIATSSLFD